MRFTQTNAFFIITRNTPLVFLGHFGLSREFSGLILSITIMVTLSWKDSKVIYSVIASLFVIIHPCFIRASSHIYKKSCLSDGWLVGWLVVPFIPVTS